MKCVRCNKYCGSRLRESCVVVQGEGAVIKGGGGSDSDSGSSDGGSNHSTGGD